MTSVTAQPIVQVVNGNEQYIWAACLSLHRCWEAKNECEREKGRSHYFHAIGGHGGIDKC